MGQSKRLCRASGEFPQSVRLRLLERHIRLPLGGGRRGRGQNDDCSFTPAYHWASEQDKVVRGVSFGDAL